MKEAREMRRAQVPAVPRNYINKMFAQMINNQPNTKVIPPPMFYSHIVSYRSKSDI